MFSQKKPLPTQDNTTQEYENKHSCLKRYSKPSSRCTSNARPLWPADRNLQVHKIGLIQGTIRSTDRPNYPHESRMHNVRAGITAIYYRQEFSLRLSNFICGCCTDLVLTTHRDKTMLTQLSRVGSRLTPGERSPSTRCTGGCMGHTGYRNNSASAGNRTLIARSSSP
jgi:hypothetical protein